MEAEPTSLADLREQELLRKREAKEAKAKALAVARPLRVRSRQSLTLEEKVEEAETQYFSDASKQDLANEAIAGMFSHWTMPVSARRS